MRLGAPVADKNTPEAWINDHKQHRYRAAYYPLDALADSVTHQAYVKAAKDADIIISEVGAWSNPISPDDDIRKSAIEKCERQLALADEVGARCCVNIAGSRGTEWDRPHKDNLSTDTFDLIIETTRHIIDSVQPKRTYFTLEAMPWVFPDSPQIYLSLVEAIDRKHCAVHLDPVNMINSPRRYFDNTDFLKECFSILGEHIKSIHAKDIIIRDQLTVHMDEVRPGLGALDYSTFLICANQLKDVPFMLEHLPQDEYPLAADYVRQKAKSLSIEV
jgi:sugar phosphate isomerase/epimerase